MAVMVAVGLNLVLVHAGLGEDFLIEFLLLGHQRLALLHVAEHGAVHHPHLNGVRADQEYRVRAQQQNRVAQRHSVLPLHHSNGSGQQ